MFLIIGVNDGQEALYYDKLVYFPHLGKSVNVTIYMTFMQLMLFFIPTFKWRKEYYVALPNGEVFALDPEVGRKIARGQDVDIQPSDMSPTSTGTGSWSSTRVPTCPSCGYPLNDDFDFCPKCGRKL